MMMALLILKSKIKNFYEQYYQIVRRVIKVILMFGAFLILTNRMDFDPVFGNPWLLLIAALICGFTPDMISVLTFFLLICGEVAQVSLLLALIYIVILMIYFLLFGRFHKENLVLIFTIPVLFPMHLGYAVPMVLALFSTPVMIPSIMMGTILHYLMLGTSEYVLATARMTDGLDAFSGIQYVIDYVLTNKEMGILIVAVVLVYLLIYFIRRMAVKNAMSISILVGTIALMTVLLLSNIAMELNLEVWVLTGECLLAMAIAYIVQFFYITLDYHGTRKLQFEDDEYYYYVTAVPKMKVAVVDKTVTRIVPEEEDENFDLKQELEKALEEENV